MRSQSHRHVLLCRPCGRLRAKVHARTFLPSDRLSHSQASIGGWSRNASLLPTSPISRSVYPGLPTLCSIQRSANNEPRLRSLGLWKALDERKVRTESPFLPSPLPLFSDA